MEMFQQYFVNLLKNHYADFNGRARRKEYWMFILFSNVLMLALYILLFIGFAIAKPLGYIFAIVLLVYGLGVIVPLIAVNIRRLHDIGKPGVWILVCFVPFVGGLIFLYFCILDSQPGPNDFGPNPKEGEVNQQPATM